MPDLETKIAAWRKDWGNTLSREPVDELESHLGDEIDRLKSISRPEEEAFKRATIRLGHAGTVRREFWKSGRFLNVTFLALVSAVCGIAATVGHASGAVRVFPFAFEDYYNLWVWCSLCHGTLLSALAVRASWRHWHYHDWSAARSLLSFNCFIAWFVGTKGFTAVMRPEAATGLIWSVLIGYATYMLWRRGARQLVRVV